MFSVQGVSMNMYTTPAPLDPATTEKPTSFPDLVTRIGVRGTYWSILHIRELIPAKKHLAPCNGPPVTPQRDLTFVLWQMMTQRDPIHPNVCRTPDWERHSRFCLFWIIGCLPLVTKFYLLVIFQHRLWPGARSACPSSKRAKFWLINM